MDRRDGPQLVAIPLATNRPEVVNSMETVLIKGHVARGWDIGRILAAAGVMVGLVVQFFYTLPGWLLVLASSVLLVTLQVMVSAKVRSQCWVKDTGTGFELQDRQGRRSYEDEDVVGLDLVFAAISFQGEVTAVRRIFQVKVEGEPTSVCMTNLIPVGSEDPLQSLIDRLARQYLDNAVEALRSGAVIEGSNWSLSHSTLSVKSNPTQLVRVTEIESVGVFDSQICVWKQGVDEAILKSPERSRNAFLLRQILLRMCAERSGEVSMSGTEGLGRVFFERKQKRIYVKALAALACFLGLPSLILLAYGIVAGELGWIVGGAVMLLLAALSALVAYDTHRSIFRCHERGVYRRSLLSESQLGYDEIREFTYQATQQYHNGIYIGTYLALVLTPDPRTDKRPLKFSTIIKKPDDSLDNLRDHIARLVAARMLERLAQGERVSWTPNLAFVTDGIEYRPASYLGRKEPRILPYEEVDAYEIRQGTFHLWDRSGGKPVIKEAVGTANFYPGYHVLISMGTRQPTADVATG